MGNVSLILNPNTNVFSAQLYIVYDDEFTSVLRKRIDILLPDWDKLFKYYDKASEDDLINTNLTLTMLNESNKVVEINARFDRNKMVICPSDNPLLSANNDNATSDQKERNMISIDLEKELKNTFDNEYKDSSSSINYEPEILTEIETARTGQRIHVPSKYRNYSLLLAGLIPLKLINHASLEVNPHKQISFFKA